MKHYKNNQKELIRHGFTLVEVLVVLFILLAISSVAVVSVRGIRDRAKIDQAKMYVKVLSGAVETYEAHVGYPPTQDQGLNALFECPADLPNPAKWSGPYLKESAQTHDPWGNEYSYASPAARSRGAFEVWSLGPDGQDGTEDDIGTWTID
ncbi:MAG: type II secretion system major pseudopilin GspG [Thermoguttaceae bacterium]